MNREVPFSAQRPHVWTRSTRRPRWRNMVCLAMFERDSYPVIPNAVLEGVGAIHVQYHPRKDYITLWGRIESARRPTNV